jgi:hypothetical protein
MNWDQIESKWAAMTYRVRADWLTDLSDASAKTVRRVPRADARPAVVADRKTESVVSTLRTSSNE